MSDQPEPQTPIERSRAETGRRHFELTRAEYDQLGEDLDAENGYPKGVGTRAVTRRSIPRWAKVEKSRSNRALVSLLRRQARAAACDKVRGREKTREEFKERKKPREDV